MNWNIIGHQQIINFFEAAIKNEKLAHAYIFYGSKQVGKRSLVRKLVQNLFCYNNNQNLDKIPCGECEHCLQLKKRTHPDVFWLKKEKDKKDITIEQVRQLQNELAVHSFFKSYKVAVIDGVEDMNKAAANALLKTLEEPKQKTVIFLIAKSITGVPKTILSRAQKIKLLPVPFREIYDYLIEKGVERTRAKQLANLANGRPGRALTFLHSDEMWQNYLGQMKTFSALARTSRVNRFKFAEKILSQSKSVAEKQDLLTPMFNLWQILTRDLMLRKLYQNDRIINTIDGEGMKELEKKYSLNDLLRIQQSIENTKESLRMNVNARLALENLLLKF